MGALALLALIVQTFVVGIVLHAMWRHMINQQTQIAELRRTRGLASGKRYRVTIQKMKPQEMIGDSEADILRQLFVQGVDYKRITDIQPIDAPNAGLARR